MIISTYEIHTETMTCLLSYHDPLVEPFLGHSFLIFRCPHVFSFEIRFLTCGLDLVVDLDDWDHVFDDGLFEVVQFSDLPHVRCYTGAYLLFVEIVNLSLI